jgi:hypothetical protein
MRKENGLSSEKYKKRKGFGCYSVRGFGEY